MYSCSTKPCYRNKNAIPAYSCNSCLFVQFLPIRAYSCNSCRFLHFLHFMHRLMYSCSTKPCYRNKNAIPADSCTSCTSCTGWCIHVQLNLAIEIRTQFLPIPAIPAYSCNSCLFLQFLPIPAIPAYSCNSCLFVPIPAIPAYSCTSCTSCTAWCIHVQLNLAIEIRMQFLPIPALPALHAQVDVFMFN